MGDGDGRSLTIGYPWSVRRDTAWAEAVAGESRPGVRMRVKFTGRHYDVIAFLPRISIRRQADALGRIANEPDFFVSGRNQGNHETMATLRGLPTA